MMLQVNLSAQLWSHEGLPGAGDAASQVTCSGGCWLETSGAHHTGLSTGLSECLLKMAAGSPRMNDPRENEEEVSVLFMTELQESHTVIFTLFARSESLSPANIQGKS